VLGDSRGEVYGAWLRSGDGSYESLQHRLAAPDPAAYGPGHVCPHGKVPSLWSDAQADLHRAAADARSEAIPQGTMAREVQAGQCHAQGDGHRSAGGSGATLVG